MSIKELFLKDVARPINGVVKADQNDNATVFQELDEYVVTNELDRHFRDFFEAYSTDISDPSIAGKVGVWISGFFGSGKSHFLKILSYILANKVVVDSQGNRKQAVQFFDAEKVRDGMTRANIDKAVSNPTDAILFNIDSKASSNDDGNPILNVFLRVFNEHQGFSGDHPHVAHMERHLAKRGVYKKFIEAFKESSGMEWRKERDGFHFYQDDIEKAVSIVLDLSPDAAHKWFEESEDTFSVSVENFCHWVKEYLDNMSPNHRMLFLVDEVGQFIGSDTKLMLTLQTITENLGTICKGRAWIVVTSQADMDAVLGELSASKANDFSKIAGRFKTRLSLSSSNTDEVIQKRLLKKTPEAAAELSAVFDKKGDILKNQIMFDRSGPTLKNFDGPTSFINNYPFAPYHFQLVQKVFEEIRKVGATGAHLAYGERSMLDAFQLAAKDISDKPIGAMVPMHQFYRAVEGFLDTAVKRTIDQATENPIFDSVDVKLLRTLFMIRYVDLVKGTLDNLVTLSIEEIDQDKLASRKQIESSLQRLEKESLITRNGDEFLFLTNEERDITRKIKATNIESSEENEALSNLIYKDILNDRNRYRYPVNKMDYSIGRYVDGHTLEGRYDSDLRVEVISPLDVDYSLYSEGRCITKSTEGEGSVLIKLPDERGFFAELGTWLRTDKYIRLNYDRSQADMAKILDDRGRENQERRKRQRVQIEDMLLRSDVYCLGQHRNIKNSSVSGLYDDACLYLLENTYSKLTYLKVLQSDPWRELNAILTVDDIGQMGLSLDGEQGNPKAIKDVEQYIELKGSGNDRTMVSEIVDRFSKRPYGWPEAEIILILGRLAATNSITFQLSGGPLPTKNAHEPLQNSRRRRDVSVLKKRQTDEAVLKQARNLTQSLFSAMGPSTEKELFAYYREHFNEWLNNLKSYKSKTDVRRFPGKKVIESAILALGRALNNNDSFDFFKSVVGNKADYQDLEEDYRDIHEFFTNQLSTWQQLQTALENFDKNKQALEKDEKANKALAELRSIERAEAPYANLHKVAGMISTVKSVNDALLQEKREYAIARVDERIKQLQGEIENSGMGSADLSNRLLYPLQLIKEDIAKQTSIPQIFMLQTETTIEHFDDGLFQLEKALTAEEEKRKKQTESATMEIDDTGKSSETKAPELTKPLIKPKPVVEVSVGTIFSAVSPRAYLESQEEVDQFIAKLKSILESAVAEEKRVRIRF